MCLPLVWYCCGRHESGHVEPRRICRPLRRKRKETDWRQHHGTRLNYSVRPPIFFFLYLHSLFSFFSYHVFDLHPIFLLSFGNLPVSILTNDMIVMNFVTNVIIVDGQAATKESTRQHAVVQNLRFAVSARVRDAFRHFGVWHWRSRGRDVKRLLPSHMRRFIFGGTSLATPQPLRVFVFMLQPLFPLYSSAPTYDHYLCILFHCYLCFPPHRTLTYFKIFG
jgi:hypothetical protein